MFRQVIVGVAAGPASHDAVAVARLLTAEGGRISLATVSVLSPVRGAGGEYGPAETAEAMSLLEQMREESGAGDAELLTVTASSVGRGLHYLAETNDADLLAVGSNARSFIGRVLVGDATRAALVGAPCAVAIAPLGYRSQEAQVARVGVGYDGSAESEAALACARDIAAAHGATVSALTVVPPVVYPGAGRGQADEALLAEARAELAALEGVTGSVEVGIPGEELAVFGATVDLLVIGSRGYGPLRRLMLGGTAVHLAGNARCPLLVLPRPGD